MSSAVHSRGNILHPVEPMKEFKNEEIRSPGAAPVELRSERPSADDQAVGTTATHQNDHDNVGSNSDDDDVQHSGKLQLALITTGICLGTFIISLDITILGPLPCVCSISPLCCADYFKATAIPTITAEFGSLEDVGWYGSSYLLTQTVFQPVFGKIYNYFETKWIFLAGLLVFEVGSVLCATANSSALLIFGRAFAGVGAAALYSGGMNIVALLIPLRKRSAYLALFTSMIGISTIVGPPLGGALTQRLNWRWW